MNHYPRHIGDITRDTFGLSPTEFGVYDRLMDTYYATEAPLPIEMSELYRLAGARSKDDRAAVEYVIGKFFRRTPEGFHQKRCDEEIARYHEGDAEREEREAHERERVRRHREERANLFKQLRESGVVPKWDTGIVALREMAAQRQTGNAPVTRTERVQERSGNAPATANQNQNQNQNQKTTKAKSRAGAPAQPTPAAARLPTDWVIPDEWLQWASGQRPWIDGELANVAASFRDYWIAKPGPDAKRTDWYATWRNWVRRERPRTTTAYQARKDARQVVADDIFRGTNHVEKPTKESVDPRDITGESERVG